jgi:hypothetical protein
VGRDHNDLSAVGFSLRLSITRDCESHALLNCQRYCFAAATGFALVKRDNLLTRVNGVLALAVDPEDTPVLLQTFV